MASLSPPVINDIYYFATSSPSLLYLYGLLLYLYYHRQLCLQDHCFRVRVSLSAFFSPFRSNFVGPDSSIFVQVWNAVHFGGFLKFDCFIHI
ncbi:hypothetical protein L1049_028307 [Liquidambar formosana]|uniref:Uncharacterized protein n=1 Tax=Liquidambar formosana TaxID=63359 RepID=A0AAP0RM98_LIQFO